LDPIQPAKVLGTPGIPNTAKLERKPQDVFLYNSSQIQEFGGKRSPYDRSLAMQISDSQYPRRTRGQRYTSEAMNFSSTHQIHHASASLVYVPHSSGFSADGMLGIRSDNSNAPEWNNDADTTLLAHPSPRTIYNNSDRQSESTSQQLRNHCTNDLASSSPARPSSEFMIQISTNAIQQAFVSVTPHIQQPNSCFGDAQSQPQPQYNAPAMQHGSGSRQSPYCPAYKTPSILSKSDSTPLKRSLKPVRARRERRARKAKVDTPQPPPLEGAVRFVNFTPNDSEIILSSVSPSGSSKTRAKREKNATQD
jgi:hypothetical protein